MTGRRRAESAFSRERLEAMRTVRLTKKNASTDEMRLGWHLRRLNGVLTAVHCGTLGFIAN